VSGVTMVATCLRTRRPSRWPFAASRRRYVVVVKVPKSIEALHRIAPAKCARAVVGKVITRENCPVFRQTAVASPPARP
jgi:hypothetical protein